MTLDPELLAMICCPETRQDLVEASSQQVKTLNAAIRAGNVKNNAGQSVTEPVDGALIRQDHQSLYPVREEIPVLLVEEAIDLRQIPPLF